MELKTRTIYGMTVKGKTTFAPGWSKVNKAVEYSHKVKIVDVEILENGDQYFTYVPVGFSSGICGFGCTKLSKIVEMVELGPASPPPFHWYPQPGNAGFDLMC